MARHRRRLAPALPLVLARSRTPPPPAGRFLGSPSSPSLWRWAQRVADLLGAGAGWVRRFAEALLRWGWFTRSARRVVDDADDAGRAGAVEAPPARRSGGADIDASAQTRVPSANGVAHHNAAYARSQGGTEAVRDGDATEEGRGDAAAEEGRGDATTKEDRGDAAADEDRGDDATKEARGDAAAEEGRGDDATKEARGDAAAEEARGADAAEEARDADAATTKEVRGDDATEKVHGDDAAEDEGVRGHDTATGQALVIAQEGARKEARGGELELDPPGSSAIGPGQAKPQPKRKKRGAANAPRQAKVQSKRKKAGNGPPGVPRPRRQPQPRHRLPEADPFEAGYDISWLFNERAHRDDEVSLSYANFCRLRSLALEGKKHCEVCDICFQRRQRIFPIKKEKLEEHCIGLHHHPGYLCEQQGCFVRSDTLAESGLHRFYLHQQKSRDWWRHLLEAHGFQC